MPTSPSFNARVTSVPPAMQRAPRSDESAAAASAGVAQVFTQILRERMGEEIAPDRAHGAHRRSSDRAHDGMEKVEVALTGTAMALPSCDGQQAFADRVEPCLIDLFADHFRQAPLIVGPGREAALPVPESSVAVGHRQKADVRHIVEQGNRSVRAGNS